MLGEKETIGNMCIDTWNILVTFGLSVEEENRNKKDKQEKEQKKRQAALMIDSFIEINLIHSGVNVLFFQWKISVVLYEIYAMHTDKLDGEETADLVINCLQKMLGLSLEDISEKLEHLVFDGVYEETENRTRGGGSLSL